MSIATSAASADRDYLVRNAVFTGHQAASLLIPPAYAILVLANRGRGTFSANRLLRATWIGGFGGAAAGGGIGYAWYSSCNEDSLRYKRLRATYDNDRIRANDHATIGSLLCSVITPALLWKRASIVNLVLGGVGLGSSAGLLTHYTRSFMGDAPQRLEITIS